MKEKKKKKRYVVHISQKRTATSKFLKLSFLNMLTTGLYHISVLLIQLQLSVQAVLALRLSWYYIGMDVKFSEIVVVNAIPMYSLVLKQFNTSRNFSTNNIYCIFNNSKIGVYAVFYLH